MPLLETRRAEVVLAALLFALPGGVRGDSSAPPAAPVYVEEVVVDAPARLVDTWSTAGDAASVEVLDGKRLRESGARSLQDALERLGGLHTLDEQGSWQQQSLSVRGLSASPVTGRPQGLSVFVDGVRVNEPAVEEVNFDLIPLEDVERIELVRGPHALFGRNTLGGAIHITTRRGGKSPESAIEVEGGSALHQATRARVSGPIGPLDGLLSVEQGSTQGWRAQSQSTTLRAFGKLGVRHGDADGTLSYQIQRNVLHEPGSLPASLLAADRSQNFTPGDFFRPTLNLVTANARERLGGGLVLAANASFRALDAEQFNASWISADTRLFNSTRTLAATVQLEHKLPLGPLRSDLAVGAEGARSDVRIVVHQEPNARVAVSSELGLPLPRVTSSISDAQGSAAAFVQERVRIVSGPLDGLALTGALRFDWIRHDVADASPDEPGKANGRADFSAWVPAAGLRWTLGPAVAFASYSGGFRAPAFLELTCADPAAPCVGLQAGVAPDTSFGGLRPVHSRTLETGVTVSPWEALAVRVSLFRVDLHDDIFSVTPPGTTSIIFQNVGDTRRQGIEASARARLGRFDLEGSYAYTLATFESDVVLATPRTGGAEPVARGAELPMNPRHRAGLGGRWHVLSWLDLSAAVRHIGSQRFMGDEQNVAPRLAAATVLDAGAEARWRRLAFFVRATNLLDARYEVFGTYSINGRAPGQPVEPFLTPGAPLQVFAGLRWGTD
jgi:outer membrane receptor protein involved in Fe transport